MAVSGVSSPAQASPFAAHCSSSCSSAPCIGGATGADTRSLRAIKQPGEAARQPTEARRRILDRDCGSLTPVLALLHCLAESLCLTATEDWARLVNRSARIRTIVLRLRDWCPLMPVRRSIRPVLGYERPFARRSVASPSSRCPVLVARLLDGRLCVSRGS